jgi:hypothetical protein
MKRSLAAVVVGLALVVPMLVEAASAWVLWREHSRSGDPKDRGGSWTIVRAMPAYRECELQLRAEMHRVDEQQKHRTLKPEPGDVLEVTQFFCLPYTIDPRTPEGRRAMTSSALAFWLQLGGLGLSVLSAAFLAASQQPGADDGVTRTPLGPLLVLRHPHRWRWGVLPALHRVHRSGSWARTWEGLDMIAAIYALLIFLSAVAIAPPAEAECAWEAPHLGAACRPRDEEVL